MLRCCKKQFFLLQGTQGKKPRQLILECGQEDPDLLACHRCDLNRPIVSEDQSSVVGSSLPIRVSLALASYGLGLRAR